MTPLRLRALNAARGVREAWVAWGILFPVYALAASLLVEPIADRLFGHEIGWVRIALSLFALLLFSRAIAFVALPLPAFPLPLPASALHLRHEIRSLRNWIAAALAGAALAALPDRFAASSIWIPLLPTLVVLFSIRGWRDFTLHEERRADRFVIEFVSARLLFSGISWGFAFLFGADSALLSWFLPSMASSLAAASVLFEGDSGQPGAVHLMALAAGAFAGLLVGFSPAWILPIAYFLAMLLKRASSRLRSVEPLDEDALLS